MNTYCPTQAQFKSKNENGIKPNQIKHCFYDFHTYTLPSLGSLGEAVGVLAPSTSRHAWQREDLNSTNIYIYKFTSCLITLINEKHNFLIIYKLISAYIATF